MVLLRFLAGLPLLPRVAGSGLAIGFGFRFGFGSCLGVLVFLVRS